VIVHLAAACRCVPVTSNVRQHDMPSRKDRAQELTDAIRHVFVTDWDPIGVMDDPDWPRDEYDSYIGQVHAMLARDESVESIARHLCFIEEKLMGLGALPPAARLEVAVKLKAIDIGRPRAV
jgi:hypothetical protein